MEQIVSERQTLALATSTANRYDKNWEEWCAYCRRLNVDQYLADIPLLERKVLFLCVFLVDMREDKRLGMPSLDSLAAAVRFHFLLGQRYDSSHQKMLGHRKMQRSDIADSLKSAATAIGFDATLFSTQSNRRGGATLMHANKVSDVEILELAKWSKRSDVPFRYNANTGRSGGALSNPTDGEPAFSVTNLRRMAAPAAIF